MSRPVAIRKIIIEINIQNLIILRDALTNYHEYLYLSQKNINDQPLSKGAIKRRLRYIEDFIDALEYQNDEN